MRPPMVGACEVSTLRPKAVTLLSAPFTTQTVFFPSQGASHRAFLLKTQLNRLAGPPTG